MNGILLGSFFLISNFAFSQENKTNQTEGLSITKYVNTVKTPQFYRSYFSEYHLKGNWYFRQEMRERSHDNLINSQTITEFPLLIKYRFNSKHSLFFGPNARFLRTNGSIDDDRVFLFATFGYQYNVTEDFSLHARVDYNLMNQGSSNLLVPASGLTTIEDIVIYRVGAKFKF